MSCRHSARLVRPWLIPWVVLLTVGPAAVASDLPLGHLFCPVNKRCQEKPPHWHIKRVCPKPICDPCTLEHHGYYHTCWRPSSVPPDWSHCPVPPPAVIFMQSQGPPPGPAPVLAPAPSAPPARRLPDPKPRPPAPGKPPAPERPTAAVVPPPALLAPTGGSVPLVTPPPRFAPTPGQPAAAPGKAATYLPPAL